MDLIFVFISHVISHFVRNGITVDDLGMFLVMVAVLIFIMRVIYRATSVLSWIITFTISTVFGDPLLRRYIALEEGVLPASREASLDHPSDLDDFPVIAPDEELERGNNTM